jgi:DNA-3-methyladenine glycosylase I
LSRINTFDGQEVQVVSRCAWAGSDPLYVSYHDREWGVPVHDDRVLFEFLILEGAQAGLSWSTILKKRDNYRAAFDGFDPKLIAQYRQSKIEELLLNAGIVRNRRKIEATIGNARAFLQVRMNLVVSIHTSGDLLMASQSRIPGDHLQKFQRIHPNLTG